MAATCTGGTVEARPRMYWQDDADRAPGRVAAHVETTVDPRVDLLLVCVAGYILTSVGRIHQLFPALEVLHPAILTGALALLAYAVDGHEQRRLAYLDVQPTRCLIALLVWMTLSIPGALSDGTSFDLVFGNFIKTALMFAVAAAAVRTIRDVERLAFAYLAGATVYAAVVAMRFDLGSGAQDWRLGKLYYYDANDFATFAVTAMPMAIYFLHAARRRIFRMLSAASLAVLTLAFVYSGSRGGFLALAAVGIFVVLRYRAIALRWRVAATALVAVVLLVTASGQYWDQMSTILSDADYNRTAETGRLQIWSRGVGYMLDYPLLGVGPGNFQRAEGTLSPFADRQQYGIGVRWNAPHNTLVQVGAELGIPGLLMFITMIVGTVRLLLGIGRRLRQAPCPPANAIALTQALNASLVGFVIGAFFLSFAYSEMLYALLGLIVGLDKTTDAPVTS